MGFHCPFWPGFGYMFARDACALQATPVTRRKGVVVVVFVVMAVIVPPSLSKHGLQSHEVSRLKDAKRDDAR